MESFLYCLSSKHLIKSFIRNAKTITVDQKQCDLTTKVQKSDGYYSIFQEKNEQSYFWQGKNLPLVEESKCFAEHYRLDWELFSLDHFYLLVDFLKYAEIFNIS